MYSPYRCGPTFGRRYSTTQVELPFGIPPTGALRKAPGCQVARVPGLPRAFWGHAQLVNWV